MKHFRFGHKDRELVKKIEQAVNETVVHKQPFFVNQGVWPFIVFGPDKDGNSVIREGAAEQMKIQSAPVYIATVGGELATGGDQVPIEDLAGGDIPEELSGLMVHHLSPMRPLQVISKRTGPPASDALAELRESVKDRETAIIETPDESYWAFSVFRYLDESDRFFPDPTMERYFSRIGHQAASHRRLH